MQFFRSRAKTWTVYVAKTEGFPYTEFTEVTYISLLGGALLLQRADMSVRFCFAPGAWHSYYEIEDE